MAIVLFDTERSKWLYPLTLNKAAASLRCGIFTIKERWEQLTGEKIFIHTFSYLKSLYENIPAGEHIWIDASVLPDEVLLQKILLLNNDECICDDDGLIAGKGFIPIEEFNSLSPESFFSNRIIHPSIKRLSRPWQIFQWNDEMIRKDFSFIQNKKRSQDISSSNKITGAENIFIDEGAAVEYAYINASGGPVYIGKNAVVMEGAMLRGPIAVCDNAVVKMGATIYGATTIGPHSTVGGEIKNSVISGYSNKGHHGYLGDSVIGEWCNLGAGTSNSNVKNTAGEIEVWSHANNCFEKAGKKCGVIMGDYCFTAINTSINSGTVTGIGCNIFGEGFTPKHISSFSWGFKMPQVYEVSKLITHINNWKKMKSSEISSAEENVLRYIFEEMNAVGL